MSNLGSDRLDLRKRDLTTSDGKILREATLANLNWAEPRFTVSDVTSNPEFSHYVNLDPSRGDFGVVAVDEDNQWVGVAWVLFLPLDDPGYGFVDADTGEVSVSVIKHARRRGLGRDLMVRAIEMARDRGHRRLSLSVESDNPALALYRDLGFVDVDPDRLPGTMLLTW
ncbi:GNAT family N-acetyltransferase [Nocardioides sp. Y6]|uniref:GNAT family N-acetyltransferase n=1 Tax=Nocardioides malaquae TaxID=2773426 RepID=A0ABR9RVZ0_9ACTN|nr:GNAT family N-acetyltransferase [Nocardioides malaquae]MBE7325696.1 GNAT family N-acetyltransferase [Nocardioides malaquae]